MLVHNLTELSQLYLDGVLILEQGSELCRAISSSIPNLQVLSMSYCDLSGPLLESLGQLQSLSEIRLDGNNISEPVPGFFANFSNLTILSLQGCRLHGTLPKVIFHLPSLQYIDLSYNDQLDGSLPEFPRNGSLEYLCNFKGLIPKSIKNHTQLVSLSMSGNKLEGSIPSFSGAKNVVNIDLSHNGLTGKILIEISRLRKLEVLDFSNYYFNNPYGIGSLNLYMLVDNLTELSQLYLDGVLISEQGSELCRAISSSIPNLQVLSICPIVIFQALFSSPLVSFNLYPKLGWTGTISLSQFQYIDLSYNDQLDGSLPEFPRNGSLEYLYLTLTKFSGLLPKSIGNLKMLSTIHIHSCNFKGLIPKSIKNHTQLVSLSMSGNKLEGSIPSFSGAKNVVNIDLSHNGLTGTINFSHWRNLTKLSSLILSSNKLDGDVPASLFSLPLLYHIDLSSNLFSGPFPEILNVSSHLLNGPDLELDLSSNNLEGPLPMSIFSLRGLKALDLSSNNLSGSFPLDGLYQLRYLFELDLSHNNLFLSHDHTNFSYSSFSQQSTLSLVSLKLRTFPNFLRNQSNLQRLDISDN
ncbi:receptor kinase-like protein Xa21 [Rosa rugosa]|uniref:receptor kinase-like protein Xa21 n=1 Tax=Rosa rugosa TaxID=74645 RepID=UPI002B4147E8|nr:receptor kinase-like protein Xa21 [Rosa rugosa]